MTELFLIEELTKTELLYFSQIRFKCVPNTLNEMLRKT